MKALTKKAAESAKDTHEKNAREAVLEQLFNDFNRSRFQIYKLNFFRGLFFGFGSVLGGTLLIAMLIWIMTILSDNIPFLSDFFNGLTNTIESSAVQ